MLATGFDRQPLEQPDTPAIHREIHANVRGAGYYGKEAQV
jgi:hypothetical protein